MTSAMPPSRPTSARSDASSASSRPMAAAASAPARTSGDKTSEMVVMTIEPEGDSVPVRPGETILEALYAGGFSYRVGCRRGGCSICKVDLRSGEVEYNRPVAANVLTDEERADGTCLSCRAVPTTDVTIEFRDDSIRMTNSMLRRIRLAEYAKTTGHDITTKPSPPSKDGGESASTEKKEA